MPPDQPRSQGVNGAKTVMKAIQERCFSCGGRFRQTDGPTHAYMSSTPGCWATYGDLLAREYSDHDLFQRVHRLTVDSYALQHPGDPSDARARRSVWVHYLALTLKLRDHCSDEEILARMRILVRRQFPVIPARPKSFDVTHADVMAPDPAAHAKAVRTWAVCSLSAWDCLADGAEGIQTGRILT